MKKYFLIFILALAIIFLNNAPSIADNNSGGFANYEVHEWGVMVGCDKTNDYLLTSRPLQIVVVKEPVLYFHSTDKKPFSLKITFNQGFPTETYPMGKKKDNVVQWEQVSFTEDAPKILKGVSKRASHVPLEEIIGTLNDVDANEIYYNGIKSKFLFYEGEIPFENKIKFAYEPKSQNATVINNGNYPVFDLFLISSEPGEVFFQKKYFIAYISQLKPGEEIQIKLELSSKKVDFTKSLRDLGFTEKEITSFESLWYSPFLEYGKLLYRLSENECDKMIKLEFNPRPKKIKRALYVLIKY